MQHIKFYKMHGLGNDFMIINTLQQTIDLENFPISLLANRHLGIGFDQLLMIEKSDNADFACRIFNANGSEAEQCGNGMRCVARFIHEEKISEKKTLSIATKGGKVQTVLHDYQNISVSMGVPVALPKDITLTLDDTLPSLDLVILSMGNPHAIMQVPQIKTFPVREVGPKIQHHAFFPDGTNVGFMEIVDREHIRLRTFERGVGETHACGTNACAAVVAGIWKNWLDAHVTVELIYGNLSIEWPGKDQPVIMRGPAEKVFSGTVA